MDALLTLLVLAETEQEHRDTRLVFTEAGVTIACHQATTAANLCHSLQATDFSAIVLHDAGIASQTREALVRIRAADPQAPVIILTAPSNGVTAEAASEPTPLAPFVRRVDRNNPEEIIAAAQWAIAAHRSAKLQCWLTNQACDQHHLATIGAITSGMSHDFNNCLTAISGSVSLLAGRFPEDPLAEKALAMIQNAAQQAANLAKSLMYAEQHLPSATESFDLNRLAHDAATSLAVNTNPRFGIDISAYSENPKPNWVMADRRQTWLVFMGLIAAASESTPSGGKLRISIERPPKQTEPCALTFATVRFACPQPWIEADGTLFCKSPSKSSGTSPDRATYTHAPAVENAGLTLPLLASLVYRQGGSMRLGAGTEDDPVAFTLPTSAPLRPDDAQRVTHPGTIAMLTHRCYYGLLLGAGLTTAGFHIRRATRTADLLRMFDRQPAGVDLLLLEAASPQVDGLSCLQTLRNQGVTQPAILLVGPGRPKIETSQLAEVTVVHKPVNLAELAKVCLMARRDAKNLPG